MEQINIDPMRVIESLRRKLDNATSEASQWEAAAQSLDEEVRALRSKVEELEAPEEVEKKK